VEVDMRRRIILTGLVTALALTGIVFVLTREHLGRHVVSQDVDMQAAPLSQKGGVAKTDERKPGILDLYK
jgi:hypothetical protein